jgi:hypothetical protein
MNKENVVYTQEYHLALKKEENSVICDKLSEPKGYYSG